MSITALEHRNEIIAQVADGVMLDRIATSLGIRACSISEHLAKEKDYQEAREIGAELRLHRSRSAVSEIADLGVSETGEIVGVSTEIANLARVREQRLRADQWFAEREFGHRWGQKPTTQVLVINGLESDPRLIADALALLPSYPQAKQADLPNNEADNTQVID